MSFFKIACRQDIQKRSIKTALLVGSILGAINYGDVIMSFSMLPSYWLKLLLTYLVPYSVSTWASVQAIKA